MMPAKAPRVMLQNFDRIVLVRVMDASNRIAAMISPEKFHAGSRRSTKRELNLKSEVRNPSSERNPKPEARKRPFPCPFTAHLFRRAAETPFRPSDFGLLSGFGNSDFGIQFETWATNDFADEIDR
jgi:hypothetical protein